MTASTQLEDFIGRHDRILVLTGAGCSTESGIQDYRDANGEWKRAQPITWQRFMGSHAVRQRYWARSLIGWRHMQLALPNAAHRALAALEATGRMEHLVTQNVDGLHQAAGSLRVIDLHGRIDQVCCMSCARLTTRAALQDVLAGLNPDWIAMDAAHAPDGDADLDGLDFGTFHVPACPQCGGILKPDVVFFGENMPASRRGKVQDHLAQADAMLVVGTSLMVPSGYRLVARAAQDGKPVVAVTLGRTRADDLFSFKVTQSCTTALSFLL